MASPAVGACSRVGSKETLDIGRCRAPGRRAGALRRASGCAVGEGRLELIRAEALKTALLQSKSAPKPRKQAGAERVSSADGVDDRYGGRRDMGRAGAGPPF